MRLINKKTGYDLSSESISMSIEKALSAPLPQIAIHYLINKLFREFEPKKEARKVTT